MKASAEFFLNTCDMIERWRFNTCHVIGIDERWLGGFCVPYPLCAVLSDVVAMTVLCRRWAVWGFVCFLPGVDTTVVYQCK